MSAFQPLPGVYYICLAPGITQSCAHMAIRTPHIIAIFNDRCGWKCSHSTTRNPLRIYTFCAVLCVFYCIFFLCNTRARTSSDMCLHCMGHGQRLPYHVRRIVICGIFGLANVKWMDRPGINRTSVHFKCFYFVFFSVFLSVWFLFGHSGRRFVRWKYDTGEANLNEIDVVIIGFQWDNCQCWLRCRTKLVWLIYSNP